MPNKGYKLFKVTIGFAQDEGFNPELKEVEIVAGPNKKTVEEYSSKELISGSEKVRSGTHVESVEEIKEVYSIDGRRRIIKGLKLSE